MNIKEQIKIVNGLLDATYELNGEYQEGWDEDIKNGERLLEYLEYASKKLLEHIKK